MRKQRVTTNCTGRDTTWFSVGFVVDTLAAALSRTATGVSIPCTRSKGAGHKADNYDGQGQRHHSKIFNPLHNILLS